MNNVDVDIEAHAERYIDELVERMTIDEKIGQLILVNGAYGNISDELRHAVAGGRIGAVLNEVDRETINELQRIAIEESRLQIPLLIGRDVIHGFTTVFPVPLGQAASWNPDLVERCARVSAMEAASVGVNWTFAPMVDITRDPRWGRVAESLGEDPHLTSVLGVAMVRGFQGSSLADTGSIAACAKHFAGYGASESGRDYNTASIPETELRNVHLRPFKAAIDAGVASIMTSFSDLNGIPATANQFLLKRVLRDEWSFNGFVVSDWNSISELTVHGLTSNDKEAAFEAASAGVDMEMASNTYARFLAELVQEGKIPSERLDMMVANILRTKFRLGLFQNPFTDAKLFPLPANDDHLLMAHEAARQSIVLLKNDEQLLPLAKDRIRSLAVIGPLADDGYEQLGTWIFDGDPLYSQTPLRAIEKHLSDSVEIHFARGLETTRTRGREGFHEAIEAARKSDVVLLFLGEESILSGEAHCRADITLPGAQEELIAELGALGKPLVLVIMAGRPLALQNVVGRVNAVLMAWHPGTMAGPAITDILFGEVSPSGKLPVTFPRVVGQIPIYYSQKNTGRPPTRESMILIDDIPRGAKQVSIGNTSFHLDVENTPLYPFGFGLTYSNIEYANIQVNNSEVRVGETISVTAEVANKGDRHVEEIVQLYVRDLAGSLTRPVKELKDFKRVPLNPGETLTVAFELPTEALAFFNRYEMFAVEPGEFHVWIGGNSDTSLRAEFKVVEDTSK